MQDGGRGTSATQGATIKGHNNGSTMSKVFVEEKKFHFIREVVRHEGFWDMLFAIYQCWYPLFRLLRLSDLAIGGIDKV